MQPKKKKKDHIFRPCATLMRLIKVRGGFGLSVSICHVLLAIVLLVGRLTRVY